jgi:hypothetical protein
MRALVDANPYFNRIEAFYRMFSFDTDYTGQGILVEPANIDRFSTAHVGPLLDMLIRFGRRNERDFLICTHGNPQGLPLRIRGATAATMNHDFMDALSEALSPTAADRRRGREFAMSYGTDAGRAFSSEDQLDAMLDKIRTIRGFKFEHLEFRGCNIGAGPALAAVHKLLGARITAAPTVQFIWALLPTTNQPTTVARFEEIRSRLPADRREFTRGESYGSMNPGSAERPEDIVVAFGLSGDSLQLVARSGALLQRWTQAFLQDPILFAVDRNPPGGGFRIGGNLPLVGFLTPRHSKPFVFPGDSDYSNFLDFRLEPAPAPAWLLTP